MAMANHGHGKNFSWARLEPARGFKPLVKGSGQPVAAPQTFVIQVKSDSDQGRILLNDPLQFFNDHIPEILEAAGGKRPAAPGKVLTRRERNRFRASVMRLNAEIPANPVHRLEVWATFGGLNIAGVQYKL